jgi:hypothetical protein
MGLGSAASFGIGKDQLRASKFKRQQLEQQLQVADLQAQDDINERRRVLASTLSSQRAAAAVTGAETIGGSNQAIAQDSRRIAAADISSRRLSFALEKDALEKAIGETRRQDRITKRNTFIKLVDPLIGDALFAQQNKQGFDFGGGKTPEFREDGTRLKKPTGSSTRTKSTSTRRTPGI